MINSMSHQVYKDFKGCAVIFWLYFQVLDNFSAVEHVVAYTVLKFKWKPDVVGHL